MLISQYYSVIRKYRLFYRMSSLLYVDNYYRSFRRDQEYCSCERQVRNLVVLGAIVN